MSTSEYMEPPETPGQWVSTVEDNQLYFDALCWTFALRQCQLQEKHFEHFSNGYEPDRKGCDSCYDAGHEFVTKDLNHILSAVAKQVYEDGRRGIAPRSAERRAIRASVHQAARLAFSDASAKRFLREVPDTDE